MLPHALKEPSVPALSLIEKVTEIFGNLGPADGICSILDPIVHPAGSAVIVELDDQLHILSHGVPVIASCLYNHILLECSESSGNNQGAVEGIKKYA